MSDFAQMLAKRGLAQESAPSALGIHPAVLRQLVAGPKDGGFRPTPWELELLKRATNQAPIPLKTQAEQGTFF